MPVVTEDGFHNDTAIRFFPIDGDLPKKGHLAVDLPNDADADSISQQFERIDMIRIPFPSAADGRGFSLARQLRQLGFQGRLRAHGHVISDQFRYALECGFDEVEISKELSDRQPESQWQDQRATGYRAKLSGRAIRREDDSVFHVSVTDVTHYTEDLFSFSTNRPDALRFNAGEFVMLGLEREHRVFRAYSIASASWSDQLEFYSIKVPNGALTSQLKWVKPGDDILIKKKTTGSLVIEALQPGSRLFLHATGTGFAPFASLIQEPALYEQFDQVILTHTCRYNDEMIYSQQKVAAVLNNDFIGGIAREKLQFHVTSTRSPQSSSARITDQIESGQLFDSLKLVPPDPESDRVMVCGSKAVNQDVFTLYKNLGFNQGSLSRPASFIWERAFVD
jgi:ferredoxin--NADP+ reductase